MTAAESDAAIDDIIAKAWGDEAYRARLLADPAAVLRDEGVDLPVGALVQVLQDTATVQTLVLPTRPWDLVEDALESAAGALSAVCYDSFMQGP
ncbi:NHLP leader peptide family RiPP precursor [Nitrospirillum viridazoti]|uniref:NHLP leader peptide family natural product n=1 Tax=Nitrospirillum viridazoti CBAmc TaxID=1441467 RepID=A0A248JZC9_9PROT|nr:NHLP leader peptide family RiPP precursor [Nitrospirillum amazonense]ASG24077.1 NHLP leader peptide family natural product precursor [Nitrospirillum amazonense CBAmc]TWB40940.1 putative ribosomally synthesized peptide [Nitrospirillum amazonense]